MKNTLKQTGICVTISMLFVLVVLAQRAVGLLGPETAKVALVTAAVAPLAEVAVKNGPVFPPDPCAPDCKALSLKKGSVDIPGRRAELKNGPVFPPDPCAPDCRTLSLKNGPVFPTS